jgi:hypothetical protein
MKKAEGDSNKASDNFVDSVDLFSSSIPSFNFEGRDNVGTVVGSIGSIMALIATIGFLVLKAIHLYEHKSPVIGSF